jgi:hypothetical protein
MSLYDGVVSCRIMYQILLKSINWCRSQDGEVRTHAHAYTHTHVHMQSHLDIHHGYISLLGFFFKMRVGQQLSESGSCILVIFSTDCTQY